VVGLGVALLLLKKRGEGLGFERRPGWAAVVSSCLSTPIVFVISSAIAIQIALPTLMEELQTRGAHASQQNAGEFGRALTQAPIWTTLLWGPVLAGVGEELFFRGLLWSAITDVTRRWIPARDEGAPRSPGSRAMELFLSGGVATVLCAALFGAMHGDVPGGVGIMRVASTTCLGLALGVVRQATGSVAACIALHALYDTLALGVGRRWFAAGDRPVLDGIPNAVLGLAVGCAVAIGLVAFVRALAERRARAAFAADSQRF
jgi:membrane protease YdiL (CAAX protease family)